LIGGERHSGIIAVNGAAAHLINAGDEVLIIGFCFSDKPVETKVVLVDQDNRFVRFLSEEPRLAPA